MWWKAFVYSKTSVEMHELLHLCRIQPRKLRIMPNKGNVTSKSIHLFIRLVEAVKVNATQLQTGIIKQWYGTRKPGNRKTLLFQWKHLLLCATALCLESVWHIVKCCKISFLQYQKPDVTLCFITVTHITLNWEILVRLLARRAAARALANGFHI